MLFDGKKCAQTIKADLLVQVAALGFSPRVALIYAGEHPAINTFVGVKERFAHDIGVELVVYRYPPTISQEELEKEIQMLIGNDLRASDGRAYDAIIVQLPLPAHIDADKILSLIPAEKDIDVLSKESLALFKKGESAFLPPVAAAIGEIFKTAGIDFKGKKIVVVGNGRLVGQPVALWLSRSGADYSITVLGDPSRDEMLREADIVISGAGDPEFIEPYMIKDGAVLIDCGASELHGKTVGDISPACYDKASLATPVPGGIGPIVVAMVFRNLIAKSA